MVVFLIGSQSRSLGYSLLHVMNITIAVLNVIEITLLCQLQLMPPAVVYKYSPDYAETQALHVLSMSCQEKDRRAYATVAEHSKPHVAESIKPHMDRKVVKRVVMTVPYNAKPHSNRGTHQDALKEKGVEISNDDLTKTVKAVRDAMDEIVPGPMAVMTWFESEVAKAIKKGRHNFSGLHHQICCHSEADEEAVERC